MKWTKDKFIEYRKLKREGWSDDMLINHFGEVIFESGIYNKKSSVMPFLNFITEIKITPHNTDFNFIKKESDIYPNQYDYVLDFIDNGNKYVVILMYYIIDNIPTYNIILTTWEQWHDYTNELNRVRNKGYITDDERNNLINIIEKETGYNHIYSIMQKISYILFEFIKTEFKNNIILSIGETKNPIKINLYRNIIKGSFPNLVELGERVINDDKYYLYRVE